LTKISIITPVLNKKESLQKTIDSVIDQNVKNLEYIIVDGNSTDGTLEIIDRNKKFISKVIIGKDRNLYDAMNKGILSASGELIGIINADDYYNPGAINLVLQKYYSFKGKELVIYGNMHKKYNDLEILVNGDLSNLSFTDGNFEITHPTVFVTKSLYNKIGYFNINYQSGADRDFLLRANKNKAKFLKINFSLATFTFGGFTSSYSLKLIYNRTIEEYSILKKYYSKLFVIRKTFSQFFRMTRNFVFYNLFGKEIFLKLRMKRLKKNG